ncbi:MAG: hypothetical protein HOL51_06090 [Gemmatimonadetes bacterium]|nr:hypothetical protein [Gemmatimonadota bacterium]MBT5325680.1 hypothetical protein [Gemmatimonadota bacterium]MBT5449709.1 hypothetical protein [Gemmatimonadota bacterium]MBT5802769.1 hypothetical protein [Gemmatimonadota bacterium]MBT6621462.1 hypothetical protein [Gemmatimonadota bacterium]|tara:strand:- start:286 stop:681 length:396 start_codon:yes stop_codon:yes gene_type:complete
MMRKIAMLLVLILMGSTAYVQAQGRGGGRSGGMPLASLERDWAVLSFELDLKGDQMLALKLAYKDAWNQRKELLQSSSSDPSAMREAASTLQVDLDRAVNNILSSEQRDLFNGIKAQQSQSRQGARGGRGR